MSFGDRNVTVRLALSVRDYLTGATAVDAANRRMMSSQEALGNSSRKLGGDVGKAAKDTEKSAAGIGTALKFTGIGLAGLGAAGGALKILPPILAAVGATAGALPTVLGGAANSAIVLKLGMQDVGAALGAVYQDAKAKKDPYSALAFNAQALTREVEKVKPALTGMQQGFQNRVFKGTAQDLDLIASKTLPAVKDGLNNLADDWSSTFAEIALTVSDPKITDSWNTVLGGADRFFDGVNARIRPIGAALADLATEGEPVADQIGKGLFSIIDKFTAKVEAAKRSGSLADFFEAGADAAREMAQLAGNVLTITGQIVGETAKQEGAVASLGGKLNAYIASGRSQEDIAGIVHTLTTAYEGLAATIGPIGGVLRDALADPGTAQSISQMFTVLSAGSQVISTVLQLLLSLNNAFGGAPLTIIAFVLAMTKMNGIIGTVTAAAEKGAARITAYGVSLEKTGAQSLVGARGLENYGGAIQRTGAAVPGLVGGLGKAATAWLALNAAHDIYAQATGDDVDMNQLATDFSAVAKGGQDGAEMTRDFGKGLKDFGTQLQMVNGANGGGLAGFIASANQAVPIAGDIAKLLGAPMDFNGSKQNFAALDQTMADYVHKTGDVKGAQDALNQIMQASGTNWADLSSAVPQTTQALNEASVAQAQLEAGTSGLAARQALLNAPLQETITLGRTLAQVYDELNGANVSFAQATISAQQAVDDLNKGLSGTITTGKGKKKKTRQQGLALTSDGTDFDTDSELGRKQASAFLEAAGAASKAAQAKKDDNGTVAQAAAVYDQYINRIRASLAAHGADKKTIDSLISTYAQMPKSLAAAGDASVSLNANLAKIPKNQKFVFDGSSMIDAKGHSLELAGDISKLPVGKTFTWNGKSLVDGRGKAIALKGAIEGLPPAKSTKITLTDVRKAQWELDDVTDSLQGMPDGVASIHVNNGSALAAIRQVRQSLANLGGATLPVSANRAGGIHKRAAAAGLVEAHIAPPGTLYQWAEPETGGEAFVPRKGDTDRGRRIVSEAAGWYGMRATPMAAGGITVHTAASGLVNVAPVASTGPKGTRLEFAQAYDQARDAVAGLNAALKQNKKSFNDATTAGRADREAVYSAITAAQGAATAKYNETGSVKLANAAYAEHIRRLKALLAQQKISSSTVRSLLALAQPPVYDTTAAAPKNSTLAVAAARSQIAASSGATDLQNKISLFRTGVTIGSENGNANLGAILDFLGQAGAAAQDRYAQSGSSKLATALYGTYLHQLKTILSGAGYKANVINNLINAYGKITLSKNARGGIHYAAAGAMSLGAAGVYPSSSTLYGFAEPGTGGEAFIPCNGDRQRGRELLDVAAGWYGGRFAPSGAASSAMPSADYSTHLTVNARQYTPTSAELNAHQRQLDAEARVGRRR
jgi:arsenate reductase-like glutaredoxin family protein